MTNKTEGTENKPRGLYQRLVKGGGTYAIGGVLEGGLSFLLLPLLTVHLALADFGIVGIVTACTALATAIIQSPFTSGFRRYYFREDQAHLRGSRLFLGFLLILVQAVPISLILLFFRVQLATSLLGDGDFSFVFAIYSAILVVTPFQQVLQVLLRVQDRAILYVVLSVLRLIGYVGLVLYLLIVQEMGLKGLLLGYLFRSSFDVIVLLPYILKQLKVSFDFKQLKPCLSYGYPLIISIASMAFMLSADKLVLRFYDPTLTTTGLYSFGARFGVVISMLLNTPMRFVINPLMFEFESKVESLKTFLARVSIFYFRTAGFLAVCFSLFAKDIVSLVAQDSSFDSSWVIIPLLSLSSVFDGLRDFTGKGLAMANKTTVLGLNVLWATILNVVLNFILIPYLGIAGAALASTLSYLYLTLNNYHLGQKHYRIPYAKMSFIRTLVGLSCSLALGAWMEFLELPLLLSLASKLLILLLTIGFLISSLTDDDRELLSSAKEKIRKRMG